MDVTPMQPSEFIERLKKELAGEHFVRPLLTDEELASHQTI
jgi:hypothetical protein